MDSTDMELYEDYQSPFDFDSGVNKNYLYLSPSGNMSPPGSPMQNFGNYWFCMVLFTVIKPTCNLGSSGFRISVKVCEGAPGLWLATLV